MTSAPGIWRAVADPTRRRLIELLRGGPRTTGDLAAAFSTSRFAVMKHLRVLEAAGLVRRRRDGRVRWNELIPAALVELEGRWREPRAAGPGEAQPSPAAPTPRRGRDLQSKGLAVFDVQQDVFLDVVPSRVFDALTFGISAWWGPPFLRSPSATGVVLEGHLGGRFSEEWGHRQGTIRGIVTAIRQDERIEIAGSFGPRGPLPAVLEFVLVPREGGTLLRFSHRGMVADAGEAGAVSSAYRAAWRELLLVRLKAFVERGVRSGLGDGLEPVEARSSDALAPQRLF